MVLAGDREAAQGPRGVKPYYADELVTKLLAGRKPPALVVGLAWNGG